MTVQDIAKEGTQDTPPARVIKLQDLKAKSPTELLAFAEEHEVENASTLRKQELMFALLKNLAGRDIEIVGEGVVEVLQDGFGFLRSPDANYLPGPDDIYVSPSQIRRFGLRTGDTVEGMVGRQSRVHSLGRSARLVCGRRNRVNSLAALFLMASSIWRRPKASLTWSKQRRSSSGARPSASSKVSCRGRSRIGDAS